MIETLLLSACIITAIHDGDTMTVQCPARKNKIVLRIAEIDAPELKAFTWGEQPGAQAALAGAKALCGSMSANVQLNKYDSRTKRWIAHVDCGGSDLSLYEVSHGLAWSYIPDKNSRIPGAMALAQKLGVGLWATPNPIQPSVWRKNGMHQ